MPKEKTPRQFTCAKCPKPVETWSSHTRRYETAEPHTIRFRTAADLDKHLEVEHRTAMFRCTAVGCLKGALAPKFQKSETLTQHIKESHKPDTIYDCPVKDCTFLPSVLDDFAVHAYWTHSRDPATYYSNHRLAWKDDRIRPMFNAATWLYFRCPIWNCRKFISGGYNQVSTHLLKHFPIELEQVQHNLSGCGYELFPVRSSGVEGQATQKIMVHIKCPACDALCESGASFRRHLEADHILARSSGTSDHFETWRRNVESWTVTESMRHLAQSPCWMESTKALWIRSVRRKDDPRVCSYPGCSFQWNGYASQHPSLLRDVVDVIDDLFPHRMRILQHYPAFISHPCFKDSVAERRRRA
jgi:hypothetical protein